MMRTLSVVAVAMLLAGCNTSYNYFKDDTSELPQGPSTGFGMILEATGVVQRPQQRIEHKPRGPLAMPPSRELPAPVDGVPATADVNWPTDPDVVAAQRRRDSIAAGAETERYENSGRESDVARVSPQTVQDARLEGGGVEGRSANLGDEMLRLSERLSPRELARTFRGRDNGTSILTEDGQATPRRYLIEPPSAYRAPSESAPLPDVSDIEHSKWGESQLYRRIGERRPPRAQK